MGTAIVSTVLSKVITGTIMKAVVAYAIDIIISFALSWAIGAITGSDDDPLSMQDSSDRANQILSEKAANNNPIPVVYGYRQIGGTICYMGRSVGVSKGYRYLFKLLVLCEGEIDSVKQVKCDDTVYTDPKWDGKITVWAKTGTDDQTAVSTFVTQLKGWTEDHRLRGIAYIGARFKFDYEVFSSVPKLTALIKGTKVYDARTGLTEWSDNPAWCIYDYLTNVRYGKGIASSEIDTQSFIVAANYCDEVINMYGVTQKRYTCNGYLDTGRNSLDNVKELLTSCQGSLVFTNGKYKLVIDKPTSPSTFELTEDNIIGQLGISLGNKKTRFNKITAVFFDPDKDFQENEAVVESAVYKAEDNNWPLERTIKLPFTNDFGMAKMIATVHLHQSREQISVQCRSTIAATQLEICDVIKVTHSTPAWEEKEFRVIGIKLRGDGEVDLSLREYEETVYDYTSVEMQNVSENTELTNPLAVPKSVINVRHEEEIYYYRERSFTRWNITFDPPVDEEGEVEAWWNHANIYVKIGDADRISGEEVNHDDASSDNSANYSFYFGIQGLTSLITWSEEVYYSLGTTLNTEILFFTACFGVEQDTSYSYGMTVDVRDGTESGVSFSLITGDYVAGNSTLTVVNAESFVSTANWTTYRLTFTGSPNNDQNAFGLRLNQAGIAGSIQFKNIKMENIIQDWKFMGTSKTSYRVDPVEEGQTYYCRMQSVTINDVAEPINEAVSIQRTILGKIDAPGDMSAISAIVTGDTVNVHGIALSEPDIAGYEFRISNTTISDWDAALYLSWNSRPMYNLSGMREGTFRAWCSPVGNNGFYSENPVYTDFTIGVPPGYTLDQTHIAYAGSGTHSGTESYDQGGGDYAIRVNHSSGNLVGTYSTEEFDTGVNATYRVQGDFIMKLLNAEATWNNLFPATVVTAEQQTPSTLWQVATDYAIGHLNGDVEGVWLATDTGHTGTNYARNNNVGVTALSFTNDPNEYGFFADDNSLDSIRTFSAWIRPASYVSSTALGHTWSPVVMKNNSSWVHGLFIRRDQNPNTICTRWQDSSGNFSTANYPIKNPNDWMSVIGILDSEFRAQLYINGYLVSSGPEIENGLCSGTTMTAANLFIGGYNGTRGINCEIANVQAFNRPLSAAEVTELYHDRYVNPSGLVLKTFYDPAATQWAVDFSPEGNNGTLVNAPAEVNGPRYLSPGEYASSFAGTAIYLGSTLPSTADVIIDYTRNDGDTWDTVDMDSSWNTIYGDQSASVVNAKLQWGTSPGVYTNESDLFHLLAVTVTGRYFQIDVEIEDPTLTQYTMLDGSGGNEVLEVKFYV